MPWTRQDEEAWKAIPPKLVDLAISMERLETLRALDAPVILLEGEQRMVANRMQQAGFTEQMFRTSTPQRILVDGIINLLKQREEQRQAFNKRCMECRHLHSVHTFFRKLEHCSAYPRVMQPDFFEPCTKFKGKR